MSLNVGRRVDDGLKWGVESICAVLVAHGVQVAPSTFYDARHRPASRRHESDEHWKEIILAEWRKRRILGARKLWLRLRRLGHDIARCTVERLMRQLGIQGAYRGKKPRTTIPAPENPRPRDLVDRHFQAFRPNRLWVADFTYSAQSRVMCSWAGGSRAAG